MPLVRITRFVCMLGVGATLVAGLIAPAAAGDPLFQRLASIHARDRPVSDVDGVEREVTSSPIDYAILDGEPVRGYMARPADTDGPTAALLVVHEWWGLNDNIRAMTRRLAANGYTALAVDLYGGKTAESPEQARSLMQQASDHEQRLRRNLREGFLYLDVMPSTTRVGAIGWCFGGGWSLRTALMFPQELDAAVIYYGEPVSEASQLAPLSAPVLGHFGSGDSSIPTEKVRRFDELLSELDKPHEIHLYEGAGHACVNPSGKSYAEEPAQRAWERTITFLEHTLKSKSTAPEAEATTVRATESSSAE